MNSQEQWSAKVTYRDQEGKTHSKSRDYPLYRKKDGTVIPLDRTRVIGDLVPKGCTTTSTSVHRK